ncbi:MAG: L-type lectin-domain containing protein [Phycisphaerales bacterium]|nr:L-type lectin-domain containing protein [Phycisphaerales bacterium]
MHRTAIAAALLTTSIAAADVVDYTDFSDTTGLAINGSAGTATTSDGEVMRLTPATSGQAGSIFSDTQVDASDFSTKFSFRISDPGGSIFDGNTESGADGFVFVVQPIDSSLGSVGQGIGYAGIGTSLGVEFDTWHNSANNDPSQSHVGVNLNGSVNHNSGLPTADITGPELDDGDQWFAWIDYDGTNLEVRLSLIDSRPIDALISYELDLVSVLGQETAFVGFTSATGAAWANHDILNWSYTGFVPAPSSAALLALAGFATTRRRR